MELNSVSLARQVDFVFRQLEEELTNATAGTVLICIRNNVVGKFGMKHHPIESKNGQLEEEGKGLTSTQVKDFRQLALDALKYRRNWTHGEICYDFAVRPGSNSWSASILYESNYNTANWNSLYKPRNQGLRDTY